MATRAERKAKQLQDIQAHLDLCKKYPAQKEFIMRSRCVLPLKTIEEFCKAARTQ